MSDTVIYSIPARFRRVENLHILFWLVKDAAWALNLKEVGVFMIIPTLSAALLITWQTRKIFSELMHNLAVDFWIVANCTWMIGEFYGMDEGTYGLRHLALIPFVIGLLILATYYFLYYSKKTFREKVVQQTEQALEEEMLQAKSKRTA